MGARLLVKLFGAYCFFLVMFLVLDWVAESFFEFDSCRCFLIVTIYIYIYIEREFGFDSCIIST